MRIYEINWVEAADYYACLHAGRKTHLLRRSMADLDTSRFCRVSRSSIVNLSRVQELSYDASGEYELVLRDGTRLKTSRGYREKVQAALRGMTSHDPSGVD